MNLDELKGRFETAREIGLEPDELAERSEARGETSLTEFKEEFKKRTEAAMYAIRQGWIFVPDGGDCSIHNGTSAPA